jgi:hypothetical protein
MIIAGLGTMEDCAGETRQEFTLPTDRKRDLKRH